MDCTRLTRTQLIDELKKQQQCVQALEEADAHRKQAVEELRRSEQMFRGMVENANDIIYTLSTDGTLLYVSPNWTENLGHDVSEVVGRVFIPFVHPDDVPRCLAFLDKVLKTGKKQRGIEYRVKHKDGSWRWHTSNGSILKTSQGETIYAGIAHDITERKRFEAELEQKNAELEALLVELSNNKDVLQAIFDSSPSALVMANRDGVIAACNRQIKEFFGIEIGETMHTHVLDLAESIKDCFQDRGGFTELARRLQEHPDPSCFEPVEPEQILARAMRLERPKRKDISLFSLPVLGRKGQEMGRLWVFLDMTKQKQADEQLHTIVEVSPVPLIITRVSDGEILFANQPLGTLVGVAPKDLIGRRSPDFYSDAEDRMLILERLARDGYLRNHEVRLKRLDGSTFWALTSIVTTEIGGEPVVIAGIHDISERRQMEDALRWERNFVSAVLDTAGALVLVLDREGRIVRFNKASRDTTGYAFEEVQGKRVWELFSIPEEIEEVKAVFKSLQAGRFPNTHEHCWLTKDGSKRVIAWSNTALTNVEGEIDYIVATGIDITGRKQAVEALATRLKYEEALAACSQALLTRFERPDAITEVLRNLQKASNTGRVYVFENFHDEADGLCTRQIFEVCAPAVKPEKDNPVLQHVPYQAGFDRWRETLSRGEPLQGIVASFPQAERDILAPQGILSILALPIWVEEEWYGFIGFDDVSEERQWSDEDIRSLRTAAEMVGIYLQHKRVEEALRVSEERFRSLVENADDIIYSTKPDGTLTYVSPKFTEATGYEVSDFMGRPVFELICPDDVDRYKKRFHASVKTGKGRVTTQEFRIEHKDGSWRWFVSNSSVIRDEDGKPMETVGIAHDITTMRLVLEDLEEANKNLKETQAQLAQSEKMASLGVLVAGIAHEINTPVGAISSMHDTLFRAVGKVQGMLKSEIEKDSRIQGLFETMAEANKIIDSGSRRVIDIVRRLKSFARLDEAELQKADIHEGLEDTLTLIHHELKHRIEVTKNFGDIPPISCYPRQLNQVFLNLLINASQGIEEKGEIIITTSLEEGKVLISFEDDGRGISRENLKRVFDPGFTTKGVGVGTGLGLSICYQIIKDHRGTISTESELGKGTSFTLALPTNLDEILEKER